MTLNGHITRSGFYRSALFLLSLTAALAMHAQDKKITSEELISRHLESIGPAEARQRLESRTYFGEGVWRLLVGGIAHHPGLASFVSSKDTFELSCDSDARQTFYGEQFRFDGKNAYVKQSFQNNYSVLGRFILTNDRILREGLLGGSGSLSWALQNVAARKAKVKYRGLKNVDGRSLHRLDYQPRKRRGNLKIELYFDPETYRHVRTEYRRSIPVVVRSFRFSLQNSITRLTETFENFQPADGVMLPMLWKLRLDMIATRPGGHPQELEMELTFKKIHHNEPIDRESIQSR